MTEKKLETTVDRVYQGVYEAISKRSLRPGMKLGEASLAELFNVSRTSVRAALKQLRPTDWSPPSPIRVRRCRCRATKRSVRCSKPAA